LPIFCKSRFIEKGEKEKRRVRGREVGKEGGRTGGRGRIVRSGWGEGEVYN